MEDAPWYAHIAIPALMRHARTTYGVAMRAALDEKGYDDIPANGLYVIGALALRPEGIPIGLLARELRITKQGIGQLVDTLVLRDYIARIPDKEDRRQLIVSLTERGRAAAEAQSAGRIAIDAALTASVGEEDVRRTRRTLAALIEIGRQAADVREARGASDE